jgi:hypothetical protein
MYQNIPQEYQLFRRGSGDTELLESILCTMCFCYFHIAGDLFSLSQGQQPQPLGRTPRIWEVTH